MRRIFGIIALVLAALSAVAGIQTVLHGPALMDPSGTGISRAVGAFLPLLLLAIVAVWLLKTPRKEQ